LSGVHDGEKDTPLRKGSACADLVDEGDEIIDEVVGRAGFQPTTETLGVETGWCAAYATFA